MGCWGEGSREEEASRMALRFLVRHWGRMVQDKEGGQLH